MNSNISDFGRKHVGGLIMAVAVVAVQMSATIAVAQSGDRRLAVAMDRDAKVSDVLADLADARRRKVAHNDHHDADDGQASDPLCVELTELSIMFDANASDDDVIDLLDAMPDAQFAAFLPQGSRWTNTATDGAVAQGETLTITYSFVPDGTPINVTGFAGPVASDLFARLDASFPGGRAAWKAQFAQAFQRWGQLINIEYVEVSDDGASFPNSAGALGARGDVRIAMRSLGEPLAVNFFPQFGGDMVLDSDDVATFTNQSGNFIRLRNVIAHEHGHGMGLNHVLPTNNTKLMEPFLATEFDGPQEDDIRGAQFIYGDRMEENNVLADSFFLGGPLRDPATNGNITLVADNLAIERNGAADFYGFTAFAGVPIAVRVDPIGTTYDFASQDNPNAVTSVDAKAVRNLGLRLWRRTNASTNTFQLVAQINFNDLGESEYHPPIPYTLAGFMVAEVFATDTTNDVQRYKITISNEAIDAPIEPSELRIFDGVDEVIDGSTVRFDATDIGQTRNRTLNVVNAGSGALEITGPITIAGPGAADYSFTLLTNTVAPGASTSLLVAFSPQAAGQRVAVMTIPNNDPVNGGMSFILSGTAVVPAVPELLVQIGGQDTAANSLLTFGDVAVGETVDAAITVRNVGNATLNVSSLSFIGAAAADYSVTINSATLSPNGAAGATIRFTPSVAGQRDATLRIFNNTPQGTFQVQFTGEGYVPISADCNTNGVEDADDIASTSSDDCDGNGVPDECQIDSDGDGQIDPCDQHPDDADNGAGDDQNTNGNNDNNDDDQNTNGNNDDQDDDDNTNDVVEDDPNNDGQNGDGQQNDDNGGNNQQDDTADAPAAQGNVCGLGSGLPLFALFGGMVGGRRALNRKARRVGRRSSRN